MRKEPKQLTDAQVRNRIVRLAFDGDYLRFKEFLAKLKSGLPEGTGVALRGSVITNRRGENGGPFDEKGRGSRCYPCWCGGDGILNQGRFLYPGITYQASLRSRPT